MSAEALGRLFLIVAVFIILGIGIQRKIFKRPHFYWAIACGILALLSTLLVTKCQSVYLQVAGVLLTLIFLLLVMCILMAGTMGQKRPLYDDKTPKNNRSLSRYRWIARLRALSHRYLRANTILSGLIFGATPAFFALVLVIVIFFSKLDPSRHFVLPEPGAAARAMLEDLTCPALVGLHVLAGTVTLTVTFICGLAFPKQSIPIGFGTGLYLGVMLIGARMVEPVVTGVSLTATCILCGYLGANLGLWVRNIFGRLTGLGANS